jgi:hypothetical protein
MPTKPLEFAKVSGSIADLEPIYRRLSSLILCATPLTVRRSNRWLIRIDSPAEGESGSRCPEADIASDAKRAMAEILMATTVNVALAARGHGGRTNDRHVTEAERVRLTLW